MLGGPEVFQPCRFSPFHWNEEIYDPMRCITSIAPPSHSLCQELHKQVPATRKLHTRIMYNGTEKVSCLGFSYTIWTQTLCRSTVMGARWTHGTAGVQFVGRNLSEGSLASAIKKARRLHHMWSMMMSKMTYIFLFAISKPSIWAFMLIFWSCYVWLWLFEHSDICF